MSCCWPSCTRPGRWTDPRVPQEPMTPAERSTLVALSAARRTASATGRARGAGVLDSTQYGPVKPARRTAWISRTTSRSPSPGSWRSARACCWKLSCTSGPSLSCTPAVGSAMMGSRFHHVARVEPDTCLSGCVFGMDDLHGTSSRRPPKGGCVWLRIPQQRSLPDDRDRAWPGAPGRWSAGDGQDPLSPAQIRLCFRVRALFRPHRRVRQQPGDGLPPAGRGGRTRWRRVIQAGRGWASPR